jgi:phage baseplate assembly protein gpV
MPKSWNTESAADLGITGKCAERHCAATEVCVPTISTTGVKDGACLSYPAICGQLSVNGGEVAQKAATIQEQSATLTCRAGHYMLPAGASGQLTCDVRGQWSPEGASCEQVRNWSLLPNYIFRSNLLCLYLTYVYI